jgi:hypothetical protein
VVKVNAGASLVMERELLPWTANPGAQKHLDPEHLLAGDSKGSSLAPLFSPLPSLNPPSRWSLLPSRSP